MTTLTRVIVSFRLPEDDVALQTFMELQPDLDSWELIVTGNVICYQKAQMLHYDWSDINGRFD